MLVRLWWFTVWIVQVIEQEFKKTKQKLHQVDSLFWGSLSAESEDLELRVIMSHLYNFVRNKSRYLLLHTH